MGSVGAPRGAGGTACGGSAEQAAGLRQGRADRLGGRPAEAAGRDRGAEAVAAERGVEAGGEPPPLGALGADRDDRALADGEQDHGPARRGERDPDQPAAGADLPTLDPTLRPPPTPFPSPTPTAAAGAAGTRRSQRSTSGIAASSAAVSEPGTSSVSQASSTASRRAAVTASGDGAAPVSSRTEPIWARSSSPRTRRAAAEGSRTAARNGSGSKSARTLPPNTDASPTLAEPLPQSFRPAPVTSVPGPAVAAIPRRA